MEKSLPKGWVETEFGVVNQRSVTKNIEPSSFPEERFELYSVPIFETGQPEIQLGEDIKSSKQLVERGDVLVCKINPRINRVWVVGDYSKFRKIASSEWIVIGNELINSLFLKYQFQSKQFRTLLQSEVSGVGGSLTRARPKLVNAYPLFLPPLPEQERIVAKLDKLFAQHEKIKQALDRIQQLLKAFRQQVLTQAVTGKLTEQWREGKNIEKWKILTIYELVNDFRKDVRTGPFGSALKKTDHKLAGLPVWGIESIGSDGKFTGKNKIFISEEKAIDLSSFKVNGGDIIISRSGTVGELCILPKQCDNGFISTNLLKISLDKQVINSRFFCWMFKADPDIMEDLKEQCKGSTRLFLTQTILKNLLYKTPPLQEQQEIVRRVESLFTKTDVIEARYHELKRKVDKLPQAILNKALKGELVPQLPSDGDAKDLLEEILVLKKEVKGQKKNRNI
ncbi:restriction endonuclease subunit S [Olivibacter sp. SA151]|uniref:restriction endonuclease subunit S n=1 Tax=Olivibacter jilunii TaxID=985016 RepID=UPI003F167B02